MNHYYDHVLTRTPIDLPSWLESWGGYNHMPEPHHLISEQDFWRWFELYGLGDRHEFRQVWTTPAGHNGAMRAIHIMWYHDRGIGIMTPRRIYDRDLRDFKVEPAAYIQFGCAHIYTEVSREECQKEGIPHCGMCWHVLRCTKCRKVDSYDSSG